jgi:hypothetical protein
MPRSYSTEFRIDWHTKKSIRKWGKQASNQQLDDDLGTHEEVEVVRIILEKGEEYVKDRDDDTWLGLVVADVDASYSC